MFSARQPILQFKNAVLGAPDLPSDCPQFALVLPRASCPQLAPRLPSLRPRFATPPSQILDSRLTRPMRSLRL
jgi:hypothetical protein